MRARVLPEPDEARVDPLFQPVIPLAPRVSFDPPTPRESERRPTELAPVDDDRNARVDRSQRRQLRVERRDVDVRRERAEPPKLLAEIAKNAFRPVERRRRALSNLPILLSPAVFRRFVERRDAIEPPRFRSERFFGNRQAEVAESVVQRRQKFERPFAVELERRDRFRRRPDERSFGTVGGRQPNRFLPILRILRVGRRKRFRRPAAVFRVDAQLGDLRDVGFERSQTSRRLFVLPKDDDSGLRLLERPTERRRSGVRPVVRFERFDDFAPRTVPSVPKFRSTLRRERQPSALGSAHHEEKFRVVRRSPRRRARRSGFRVENFFRETPQKFVKVRPKRRVVSAARPPAAGRFGVDAGSVQDVNVPNVDRARSG